MGGRFLQEGVGGFRRQGPGKLCPGNQVAVAVQPFVWIVAEPVGQRVGEVQAQTPGRRFVRAGIAA